MEGKNFSIHDTHVIAGGKLARSVLISRQLLEVTIPRDACPTPNAGGNSLLDINLATPNGVSNHLLIKMRPPDKDRKQRHEEKIGKQAEAADGSAGKGTPGKDTSAAAGTVPADDPKKTGKADAKPTPGTPPAPKPVAPTPAS